MNKTRSHMHIFFLKNKLIHRCFKSLPFNYSNWIDRLNFLHFQSTKIRISPTDIVSSLFPPRCRLSFVDVVTSLHRVTFPSHRAKMSSLPLLHLLITFHPIISPLELKMKYWICTTTADHPLRTGLPQSWSFLPLLNCDRSLSKASRF
jgi:hypothetical protein